MSIPSNGPINLCVVHLKGEDQIMTGNLNPITVIRRPVGACRDR
jgi:hypothetical protein